MEELTTLRSILAEVGKFCDDPQRQLWWIAQIAHETRHFKSTLFRHHNNPGGIVFISHALQEGPATPQPAAEAKGGKRWNYARYKTLADGIAHMWLIVRGPLTRATSLEDYVDRLKARNYFADDTTKYAKAIRFWWCVIKRELELLQRFDNRKQVTETTEKPQ